VILFGCGSAALRSLRQRSGREKSLSLSQRQEIFVVVFLTFQRSFVMIP
jgi:hypothetical protein